MLDALASCPSVVVGLAKIQMRFGFRPIAANSDPQLCLGFTAGFSLCILVLTLCANSMKSKKSAACAKWIAQNWNGCLLNSQLYGNNYASHWAPEGK